MCDGQAVRAEHATPGWPRLGERGPREKDVRMRLGPQAPGPLGDAVNPTGARRCGLLSGWPARSQAFCRLGPALSQGHISRRPGLADSRAPRAAWVVFVVLGAAGRKAWTGALGALGGDWRMEAEASGTAQGARGSLLASAQPGGAVQVRAEEPCSVELGPRLDHVRQALAADEIRAAGDDGLLAAGNASVAAAGAEVRPDEVGRKEDEAAAESQLGEHEGPEVRQSAYMAELWEEERGPQSALVSEQQFVAEGEGLTHVVQVWAEDESAGSGGKVWLDLHVGRQEEVLAEEPLVEAGEDEVPRGPEAAGQWDQEQTIPGPILAAGEEVVLEGPLVGPLVEEAEEESQAETKEQGEESGERGQAGPGRRGPSSWSPLEALEALQSEMEPVNEQARRAFSRLQLRTWQRRKPHLELRSSIIQRVRGFWAEAVLVRAVLRETGLNAHVVIQRQDCVCSGEESFVNHPQLSAMICDQDRSMLSFLIDLKVEKGGDRCKILLLFGSNPYFRNDVIVKEYLVTLTGSRATYSTPIQWHKQYEREAHRRRHSNSSLNFFNWFSDHSLAGSGRIAEYICKDLWSNPLKYYRRKMAAVEGAEESTATATSAPPPTSGQLASTMFFQPQTPHTSRPSSW